jgi:hypothetical protein
MSHKRRTGGMARVYALSQSERCPEVFAGGIEAAAAKRKLAKRGRIDRISSEAIAVNDRADLIEPPLGSLVERPRWPG